MQTVKAVISNADVTAETISLPAGKTNSVVEVEAGTPNIVVGNLEKSFDQTDDTVYTANDKQTVAEGGSVEIKLTAAEKPSGSETIEKAVAKDDSKAVVGIYIDLDLSKTVTTVTTATGGTTTTDIEKTNLSESNVLLETVIPLTGDLQGKNGYSVYREHTDPDTHETSVVSIPQSTANSDGEYFTVNSEKTVITVYAKKYSTYAIAYTEKSAVSPGAGAGSTAYPVTVAESAGGSAVPDQASAAKGSRITVTVTAAEDYRLESLKAADASGNAVALTKNNDGTYSFTMPESAVTLTPVFVKKPADPEKTGVAEKLETVDHIRYISGYPNGSVGPDRNMTRAEAAQMFYNLLLNKNTGTAAFSDVPSGMWYAKAISALASLGIIKGYGDGRFGPNDSITREQFCAMAVRFTSVAGTKSQSSFTDMNESQWSYGSVSTAAALGWINGYSDGSFGPAQPITRAQVVTIVNHMLGRSADTGYVDAHAAALAGFSDLRDSGKWYYYDMVEAADAHNYSKDSDGQETWSGSAA